MLIHLFVVCSRPDKKVDYSGKQIAALQFYMLFDKQKVTYQNWQINLAFSVLIYPEIENKKIYSTT